MVTKAAGEKQGFCEGGEIAETRRFAVSHGEAQGMATGHADERLRDGAHVGPARFEGVGAEFLHRLARFDGSGGGKERPAESDVNGVGNSSGKLPEELSAGKTEDGTPDAVDVDGDDGDVDALEDAFHAAAKGKHLADTGHLAFGKDADQFAIAQGFGSSAQGMDAFAGT